MTNHGFDTDFMGYELTTECDQTDLNAALALVSNVSQHCPHDIAAKAVGALRMRTKARKETEDDLEMLMAIFTDDVSEYPADVVVDACKTWGKANVFFPSWSELNELCDRRFRKRAAMSAALIGGM
jgi:hypothetical protein